MAIIDCPECNAKVSDKAISCPSCGNPISTSPPLQQPLQQVSITKVRGTYIMMGILLGYLGFHNFYSGHYLSGGIKLGLLLLTFAMDASTGFYSGFSLIAIVISYIWSIFEVITVKNDATGVKMV